MKKIKKMAVLMLSMSLVFSFTGCGNSEKDVSSSKEVVRSEEPTETPTEESTATPEPTPTATPKPTPKPTPVLKIGKKVKNKDWKIKLTDAYMSKKLQSSKSRTYWNANKNQAFLILEMDITCRNSCKKPVDGDAVADLIATTADGNDYSSWEYQYINSEIWCYFSNTYLDADMPIHAYIYTTIPAKQMKKKVTVDLKLAGKSYKIKVKKTK